MSTHNIGFYGELTKLIFQLSSNTHLVCFSEGTCQIQQESPFSSVSSTFPLFQFQGEEMIFNDN